jgi:4,5-DOPA dioxygenase extradiol
MPSKPTTLPALFVSHGSPMIAIEPGTTGAFLARLGPAIDARFGRPRAIVVVSPHTAAPQPVVLDSAAHHAVHDFGGFPDALYRLRYDPPGAPEVAQRVMSLLEAHGLHPTRSAEAGLDHGIWSVLRFAWPQADVPVVPLSLAPQHSPAAQWSLGEALAPLLGEGVLVLGTGSLTHDLRRLFGVKPPPAVDAAEIGECAGFRDWVAERSAAGDREALLDYRRRAPFGAAMHPTDEHWLPFYIAAGAGGFDSRPQRLHEAVTYGCVAMDAYAFGSGAALLAADLGEAEKQPAA